MNASSTLTELKAEVSRNKRPFFSGWYKTSKVSYYVFKSHLKLGQRWKICWREVECSFCKIINLVHHSDFQHTGCQHLYLRSLWPPRWAPISRTPGRSCCPPAWPQCGGQRGRTAPSASAPRSHRSGVWWCRRPAGRQQHLGSTCLEEIDYYCMVAVYYSGNAPAHHSYTAQEQAFGVWSGNAKGPILPKSLQFTGH